MFPSRRRWLRGLGAAVALLLVVAGTAQMQEQPGQRAEDGQRFIDQRAETQAMFRAVWGDQADQQWVIEHNAALARLAPPAMVMPSDEMLAGLSPTTTPATTSTETATPTATAAATAAAPTAQPTAAPPTSAPTARPTTPPTPAPGRTGGGPYP